MGGIKVIVKNKRASYDYELLEKVEAGLVLQGTEVKSLRQGKGQINEAFISINAPRGSGPQEAWVENLRIPHYEFGNQQNHEETRRRKLLLKRDQIQKLGHRLQAEGLTIIPTMLYFKGRHVKLEIALAKGKKLFDKRQDKAKKDVERKLKQEFG